MATDSTVTKLLQVSEQAAPVVQIPILVGNEMFMLTQQDVRRIEDIRHLSYKRLAPEGPITPIFNQCYGLGTGHGIHSVGLPSPNLQGSVPFCFPEATQTVHQDHEMKKAPSRCVADVEKQLCWSKRCNSTSPYSLRYSIATSTSGLERHKSEPKIRQPCQDKKHCSCQTSNTEQKRGKTASQACNTDPTPCSTSSKAANKPPNKFRSIIFKRSSPKNSESSLELCLSDESLTKERFDDPYPHRGNKSPRERGSHHEVRFKSLKSPATRTSSHCGKRTATNTQPEEAPSWLDVSKRSSRTSYCCSKR